MKKLFIGILIVFMFGIFSNVYANEICYDILKYEKDNVCPKTKDPGKCLKEAYSEYGKCVKELENQTTPKAKIDSKPVVNTEKCISTIDAVFKERKYNIGATEKGATVFIDISAWNKLTYDKKFNLATCIREVYGEEFNMSKTLKVYFFKTGCPLFRTIGCLDEDGFVVYE